MPIMLPHVKITIYNPYVTMMQPPSIKAINRAYRQEILSNFKLDLQD